MKPDPHICIVCEKTLPANLTRKEALDRGMIWEHNGKSYYVCPHHVAEECYAAIEAVPTFEKAGSLK